MLEAAFLEKKKSALQNTKKKMKAQVDEYGIVEPRFHPGDCVPKKTLGTFVLACTTGKSGYNQRQNIASLKSEICFILFVVNWSFLPRGLKP